MRASSVRSHHSQRPSARAADVNRPRSTTPSDSSASSAASASLVGTPSDRGERLRGDRAGDGEPAAQQLDDRVRRASSRAARDGGGADCRSSRCVRMDRRAARAAARPRPTDSIAGATRATPPASAHASAARSSARRSRRASSSVRKPAVSSASCSSSASRGSGRASSRTRSIAAAIERAEIAGRWPVAGAPRLHRWRPPLLERRVVEERVRLRVQDLVREAATARACRARRAAARRVDARRARRAAPRSPSPLRGSRAPSG